MEFDSAHAVGEKVWAWHDDSVRILTIGRVTIEYSYDETYEERYMCFETGVGSGTVWPPEKLFHDKESCERAHAELIKMIQDEKDRQRVREEDRLLSCEPHLRKQLENIEKIKQSRNAVSENTKENYNEKSYTG